MKQLTLLFCLLVWFGPNIFAQTENYAQSIQIENISEKLTGISRSLDSLNERLKTFSETFSSNQGLRLSEKQQTILIAFEFLNRAEQRLATLQKLKVELSEKQSSIRVKVAEVEENLRIEAIDRTISGTTNAEELRNSRRRTLTRERNDLNTLLNEIQGMVNGTDAEIRDTEMFLRSVRQRIFPAIDKEISNL